MKKLYGIVPALLTPFDEQGRIDEEALRSHCDFLVKAGVHGLFALGTTGEFFLMSLEERKTVAERVVKYIDGRIPVYIHVGANLTRDTCELASHAQDIGADGVGAVTPYFLGVAQADLIDYYKSLASTVKNDFPIYVYNIPCCTGNDMLPETVWSSPRESNIVGIKTSTEDFIRNLNLLRTLPDGFDVLMGHELAFVPGLASGVKGCISGIANAFPEIFVMLYRSVMDKELEKARYYQETVTKLALFLYKNNRNLTNYKEALHWRGLKKTYTRQPLHKNSEEEMEYVHRNLKEITDTWASGIL